jgi:hypothetical protein
MTCDELIAELRAEIPTLGTLGGIEDESVYRWVRDELRRFGKTVCAQYEDVIEVKRGSASLPANFYSLKAAYGCEPMCVETEAPRAVLQNTLFWKERVEYGARWSECDACCKEQFEKTIVENVYLNEQHSAKFHYKNPVLLRLADTTLRSACASDCANRYVRDCAEEIMINGRTLYGNFDGDVFIRYYGVQQDEDGKPEIPDTDLGLVQRYIENYVKMKIFERQMLNNADTAAATKFQLYLQLCQGGFIAAMTDAKMTKYDWKAYSLLRRRNREYSLPFEMAAP